MFLRRRPTVVPSLDEGGSAEVVKLVDGPEWLRCEKSTDTVVGPGGHLLWALAPPGGCRQQKATRMKMGGQVRSGCRLVLVFRGCPLCRLGCVPLRVRALAPSFFGLGLSLVCFSRAPQPRALCGCGTHRGQKTAIRGRSFRCLWRENLTVATALSPVYTQLDREHSLELCVVNVGGWTLAFEDSVQVLHGRSFLAAARFIYFGPPSHTISSYSGCYLSVLPVHHAGRRGGSWTSGLCIRSLLHLGQEQLNGEARCPPQGMERLSASSRSTTTIYLLFRLFCWYELFSSTWP